MTTAQEREVLKEFIEVYRENPCLWDMSSEFYRNKEMKHAAWGQLTETLKKLDPDVNLCSTKKKVDNLRGAYFRELRKVRASELTAKAPSDIFVPSLWYYRLISFLANHKDWGQKARRESVDSDPLQGCDIKQAPTSDEESMESTETIQAEVEPDIPAVKRKAFSNDSRGRTKLKRKSDPIIQTFAEPLHISEPNHEPKPKKTNYFGVYVGEQLEQTSTFQRHVAEKLISEVLFLAKTENLSYDSRIETASNSQLEYIMPSPKVVEEIEEDGQRTMLKELLIKGRQK